MGVELAMVVALALAALAVSIDQRPPAPLRGAGVERRPAAEDEVRGERGSYGKGVEAGIAWGGFAMAAVAVVGYLIAPSAKIAWLTLLVLAIASLPVAAALSLRRKPVRDTRDTDDAPE